MLDKNLSKLFGVDAFTQWLIKELDEIEEHLHNDMDMQEFRRLQTRYATLKEVRDKYCHIYSRIDYINDYEKTSCIGFELNSDSDASQPTITCNSESDKILS